MALVMLAAGQGPERPAELPPHTKGRLEKGPVPRPPLILRPPARIFLGAEKRSILIHLRACPKCVSILGCPRCVHVEACSLGNPERNLT